MTTIHISIIIYKGSPLDYPQYRHTALWLQFADRSPSLIIHVVGPSGGFEFECKQNSRPWEDQSLAKTVDVGHLTVATTPSQIAQTLQRIPVDNGDREFNCQTWIETALKRFRDSGDLSYEAYDKGLDSMVDAIAEAEDVEEG